MGGDVTFGNFINGDQINQTGAGSTGKIVYNGPPPAPAPAPRPAPEPEPRRVILVLSANPSSTPPLRLDQEVRAIGESIALGDKRDLLDVRSAPALRLADLHTAMLTYRPTVVHFCGHGAGSQGIVVTDEHGLAQPASTKGLSDLFGLLRSSIRCVVLNACFTIEQATAIAAHVPCVVGMNSAVTDGAAIEFARSFYRGVAFGESVFTAHELGRNMLELQNSYETGTPVLFAAAGVAEQTIIAA